MPSLHGTAFSSVNCAHESKQLTHRHHHNQVLVEKRCMGDHEVRSNVPCHVKDVSCGHPCGKPMPCGEHKCARSCHKGPCVTPGEKETDAGGLKRKKKGKQKEDEPVWDEGQEPTEEVELVSCGQKCGRPLKHCLHTCPAVCHPGDACPVVQCRQMVRITCPCKRRSMEVLCLRGGPAAEQDIDEFDESKREEKRQLSCDEMCEREKRNQRIDEAFGVSSGSAPGNKEKEAPVFTEELLYSARNNTVKFVQKVEEEFRKLILSPTGMRHSFPPMKLLQRQLIHELARWYRLEAVSYDPEPRRNVVVTKKNESRMPSHALLSTHMVSGRLPKVATVVAAGGSAWDMDIEADSDCVLQIYNLSPLITTEHLASFLSAFSGEYVLRWLDDFNALAVFSNVQKYQDALSTLQSDGMFSIRPYDGPKTSWLRNRTMAKGESASSFASAASRDKPKKTTSTSDVSKSTKTTTTTAAEPVWAAPNSFAILSSQAVDSSNGDSGDAEGEAADWEALADSEELPKRDVAAVTTTTPEKWNAVVAGGSGPMDHERPQLPYDWPCSLCTFLNKPSSLECEMCAHPRFD